MELVAKDADMKVKDHLIGNPGTLITETDLQSETENAKWLFHYFVVFHGCNFEKC